MRRMFSEKQIENIARNTKGIDFTNLVDSAGNPRFIEGDIDFKTITGCVKEFAKWSLSGSHLMIVCSGYFEDEAVIAAQTLADITLPEYILDKIVPLWTSGARNYVDRQNYTIYSEDGSTNQSISSFLAKEETKVNVVIGALTLTAKRHFRFEFDLLIDND